ANQKQAEMRLNRAMQEYEKLNANARQAVLMAEDATKRGDEAKAVEYTNAAEAFANRLIALEREVEDLKQLTLQASQASEQARVRRDRRRPAGARRETVGDEVPASGEVREKIVPGSAKAKGAAVPTGESVEARVLEVAQAALNAEAQARLAQINSALGIAPAP